MKLVTKVALLMSVVSTVTVATGVVVSSGNVINMTYASECEHQGKHYTLRNATASQSGTKEYWVCCSCHQHYLYNPGGQWTDAGVAQVIVDSADNRYIPKTNEADEQGFMYSADGKTIVGYEPVPGVTDIVIPEGVESIGTVFKNSNITSVSIPSTVSTIEAEAFRGCQNLKNVTIAPGVEEIQSSGTWPSMHGAFQYCGSLEWIIIPSTVTEMDAYEFGSVNRDVKIYCEATSKPGGWSNYWNISNQIGGINLTVYWGGTWYLDSNGVPHAN